MTSVYRLFVIVSACLAAMLFAFQAVYSARATDGVPPVKGALEPGYAATSLPGADARSGHTATLLNDGRVLVAGGLTSSGATNRAYLYDPPSNSWKATANTMRAARLGHTAVLLRNGFVLVIGGQSSTSGGYLDTFELFDPTTEQWALPANGARLTMPRTRGTASLLYDGRVVLTGGQNASGLVARTELYSQTANAWSNPGGTSSDLKVPRYDHSAIVLNDGHILVTGGLSNAGVTRATEIFSFSTNQWTRSGDLVEARRFHTATLMPDERVLVTGGTDGNQMHATSEIFSLSNGQWKRTLGSFGIGRRAHAATLLPNGRVLVTGGRDANGAPLALAQIFDPSREQWSNALLPSQSDVPPPTFTLLEARSDHTATVLPNGRILLIAGLGAGANNYLSGAEIYDYAVGSWARTQSPPAPRTNPAPVTTQLQTARKGHTLTLLPNGQVLAAGGYTDPNFGTPTRTAELYDPATGNWTTLQSVMTVARAGHTATLLPNGEVLLVGGVGNNTSERYNPLLRTFGSSATLQGARSGHTATLMTQTINGIAGPVLLNYVIVVGGGSASEPVVLRHEVATNTWQTGVATAARRNHGATLLEDGRLFVFGGLVANAKSNTGVIFNINTNTWSAQTPGAQYLREFPVCTLLSNGKVLVSGGRGGRPGATVNNSILGDSEVFSPNATTGTWEPNLYATGARYNHTATVLPNGKVLLLGGWTGGGGGAGESSNVTAVLFEPTRFGNDAVFFTALPPIARHEHAVVLLLNGKVLVAGGGNNPPRGTETYLQQSDLYDPGLNPNDEWRPALTNVRSPLPNYRQAEGFNLQGISEATGQGGTSSASNVPVVQMYSLGNGQIRYLPLDAANGGWTDFLYTFPTVTGFAPGLALLTIYSHGIPSNSLVVNTDGSLGNASAPVGSVSGRVNYHNGTPVAGRVLLTPEQNPAGICGTSRIVTANPESGTYVFPDLPIYPVIASTSLRYARSFALTTEFTSPVVPHQSDNAQQPATCTYNIQVMFETNLGTVRFRPAARRFILQEDVFIGLQARETANLTKEELQQQAGPTFTHPACQTCGGGNFVTHALATGPGERTLRFDGTVRTPAGVGVGDADLVFTVPYADLSESLLCLDSGGNPGGSCRRTPAQIATNTYPKTIYGTDCYEELKDPSGQGEIFCSCTKKVGAVCVETVMGRNFIPPLPPVTIDANGFTVANVPYGSDPILTPGPRVPDQYRFEYRATPTEPATSFFSQKTILMDLPDIRFTAIPRVNCTMLPAANAGTPQTLCQTTDGPTTFTIAGASASNGTLQWMVSSTTGGATAVITNATTLTPTINVTGAGTVTLQLAVTGTGDCATQRATSNVTLTVNTRPVKPVLTASSALALCDGQRLTLTAPAGAAGYRWFRNGSLLNGETRATLEVSTAGSYTAQIINANNCQSEVSDALTVTINPTVSLSTQPQNQTVCAGSPVTFGVTASGTDLIYQWRKNGTNIGGATQSRYTINAAIEGDAASYDVVVTGSCGTVTSNTAILTISSSLTLSAHPVSQTVCVGAAATFTVTASGTGLSYQWRKDGTNIAGATQSSYTINAAAAGDAGPYDVVVTGSCGTVASNPATLALNAFTLSTNSMTFGAMGGDGFVEVSATLNQCGWTATSSESWVSITGGTPGTGAGRVNFTVAANGGTTSRTAILTIAGLSHSLTQAGSVPVARLTALNPAMALAGSSQLTLTVTGENFTETTKVRWENNERVTTFVSSTQLTTVLADADLVMAGTFDIDVVDAGVPSPNKIAFTVQNPRPEVIALEPASRPEGSTGFTLTVRGNQFVTGSLVHWNGQLRTTTFVSAAQLNAQILDTDLAQAGTAQVSVFSPTPGGGTSAVTTFTITPRMGEAPQITELRPNFAIVGTLGGYELTVIGTGFVSNSVLRFNNGDKPTNYISETTLLVYLMETDMATPGAVSVVVVNPGERISNTATFTIAEPISTVSAASYQANGFAPDSIVAAFGVNLTTETLGAATIPLPTSLGGIEVRVRDSLGQERLAPLFFVSPGQVNFLLPGDAALGAGAVFIKKTNGRLGAQRVQITMTQPALFTFNANGSGVPAGNYLRVDALGKLIYDELAIYDAQTKKWEPKPFDVNVNDQVFPILYGSGWRRFMGLSNIRATLGGIDIPVLYAGPQGSFGGLDQINLGPVPRSLAGRGRLTLKLMFGNQECNAVELMMK